MNARIPEQENHLGSPTIESMLLQVTAGRDALTPGSRLAPYVVDRVIARDDLVIRYAAHDESNGEAVEIEEYLPEVIARREDDGTVQPRSPTLLAAYQAGMRAFLEEALQLANPIHPSLLRVLRSWDGNGTAYRALPIQSGHRLDEVRHAMVGPPEEAWIRALVGAVAEAVRAAHGAWLIHGNVRPGNILIRPDGSPLLLGFEAARWTLADRLPPPEPGFVAIEQLEPARGRQPGPWSDVYALAAVVYFCVAGRAPAPAAERAGAPLAAPFANALADLWRAGTQVSYSTALISGIDAALAVSPGQRLRSVDELVLAIEEHPATDEAATLVLPPAVPSEPDRAGVPTLDTVPTHVPRPWAAPAEAQRPDPVPSFIARATTVPFVGPATSRAADGPAGASVPSKDAAATPRDRRQGGPKPAQPAAPPVVNPRPVPASVPPQDDEVPTFFADIPVRHPMPPLRQAEAPNGTGRVKGEPAGRAQGEPAMSPPTPPVPPPAAVRVPVSLPTEPSFRLTPPAPAAAVHDPASMPDTAVAAEEWRAVRPGEVPEALAAATEPARRGSRMIWLWILVPIAVLAGLGWQWQRTVQADRAISAAGDAAVRQGAAAVADPPNPAASASNAIARADAALAAAARQAGPPPSQAGKAAGEPTETVATGASPAAPAAPAAPATPAVPAAAAESPVAAGPSASQAVTAPPPAAVAPETASRQPPSTPSGSAPAPAEAPTVTAAAPSAAPVVQPAAQSASRSPGAASQSTALATGPRPTAPPAQTQAASPTPTETTPAVTATARSGSSGSAPRYPLAESTVVPAVPSRAQAPSAEARSRAQATPPARPQSQAQAPTPPPERRRQTAQSSRAPDSAEPVSPRAACSPRTNFALYRCMQAQCERDAFYTHPQCVRLRQRDEVS